MSERKLKTAVLGLNDNGWLLLKAVSQIDYFQIAAVADKDTAIAESLAAEYKCAAYDDYRQLIIQNQLDCLLVAAGIHSCDEHIRTAMKKKINVLKLAPAARNFEEAAEFVRLAEDENIKFAVANVNRFAQSFLAFRQFLQQGRIEQTSGAPDAIKSTWEPFLITAVCNVADQLHPPWHTDPKLAGGGVLLHNCYGIIDQIIWNFATPQQVYSLNTNTAGDRQQRLYLTEDTAVVTMKFTDSSFGNLIASKVFGPQEKVLKLYGKDKILTVSENGFTVSDGAGRMSEEKKYEEDAFFGMREQLRNFARSILSPDENKLCSSGRENLDDMAVIESAYLSSRTGFPEEPAKVLQMAPVRTGEPSNI